jgi:penicillin-insensitive murein endopeptidase
VLVAMTLAPAAWADDTSSAVLVPASAVVTEEAALEALPEPLLDEPLNEEALLRLAQHRVAGLGPLSIGTPDSGLLVNPVPMPEGPYWKIRNPIEAYGTGETVQFIVAAIEAVEARFPGSPRLIVGDLSRRDGGKLNRHRSHQAGRDVDLGFYYLRGEVSDFANARVKELDVARTWALVRALITETDVDRVFVDRSIISVLYKHASEVENEDEDWLADVFGRLGPHHKGVIQHVRNHKNHLHVRFFNPRAQEYGRVVYPVLVEEGVVPPPRQRHRVRRGETIGGLAARYGTSVAAIRAANGMRGNALRAGRSYVIPIRKVVAESTPLVVPPRRLPPIPDAFVQAGAPELAE